MNNYAGFRSDGKKPFVAMKTVSLHWESENRPLKLSGLFYRDELLS